MVIFLKEVLNIKGSVTPPKVKLSRIESSRYLARRSALTIKVV